MKRKTAWIIALIAAPLVAAVFTLHAQTKDNGRDEQSERTRSLLADEQSRIESSEFDLMITVTDTDGKPLDGVTMELELKRPKLPPAQRRMGIPKREGENSQIKNPYSGKRLDEN